MTIALRQYREIYNKYLLLFLKEGRIPSLDEVVARAGSDLPNVDQPAVPLYSYIPQASNSIFDIHLYNKAIDNILLDLKIVFAELSEVELSNIQRILHANLFHSVHSYELNRLNSQLDALLFSLQGAEDNFFSSFENFGDTSKTDVVLSTNGIVDTYEGCLSLPIGGKGTFKIDTSSLYAISDIKVNVVSGNGKITNTLPGAKFGDIFRDTQKPWGIIIDSDTPGLCEISFTFAISREEFINRITLLHHGVKPQSVFISTSVDNVNYKDILEYSSGVLLEDQSKIVSMDFDDRLVEYVRIRLTKPQYDLALTDQDTNQQIYRYIFALKNISLYSTGRITSGTYVSKPFDFSADVPSISRLAISANEKIPDDTTVDWYIGLVDQSGTQIGNYMFITPESRLTSSGPPKVLTLQDTVTDSTYIVSTNTSYINVFDYNNIDYYSIVTLDEKPIFGTSKLYRGQRAWLKDSKGIFNLITVNDNFIAFSKGNTQKLYKITQEVSTIKAIGGISSQKVLLLSNSPLYTENGPYTLAPGQGVNVDKDTAPIYAIFSVTLASGSMAKEKLNVSFAASSSIDLGQPNIKYEQSSDIIIDEIAIAPFGSTPAGTILRQFRDGIDYIVELGPDSKPTGIIYATQNSPLNTDPANTAEVNYRVRYSTDADITRFVSNVVNNQLYLTIDSTSQSFLIEEQAIVKYRYVPLDVVKSSIKVKSGFGTSSEMVFKQGSDYIFDSDTSTIQRLSTGKILQDQDVYVDYQYNDNANGLQQYFIWAYVSNNEGLTIKPQLKSSDTLISTKTILTPNTDLGEQLYANIQGLGLIKLTEATEWPKMKGWVQFVVRSVSPESLTTSSLTAFIDQVIKLKDRDGQFIFVSGGKYFKELAAYREPMTQVSLPFLKTNVLKNDRNYFAIQEVSGLDGKSYNIVINFEPGATDDLYLYSVDTNTNQIIKNSEEWKLDWSSSEVDADFKKVIVKAILNRKSTANGNKTPKVYSYYLKVSY